MDKEGNEGSIQYWLNTETPMYKNWDRIGYFKYGYFAERINANTLHQFVITSREETIK